MRLEKFNIKGSKAIGEGGEKATFVNPKDESKVISVFEGSDKNEAASETPRRLKGAFYLTKIAHLLLPQHVPDIFQAGETADGQMTFDRPRLPHSPEHAVLQETRISGNVEAEKIAEQAFRKSLEDMGVGDIDTELEDIGIYEIDGNLNNYLQDAKGDLQYIETFKPWSYAGDPLLEELGFSEPILREAIAQCPDAETRRACESYLARLIALYEEERAEVLKKQDQKEK